MVFCHNCGHRNPPDANFCSSCGSALAPSTDTTVSFVPIDAVNDDSDEELIIPVGELALGSGVLVIKRGSEAGAKFVLDPRITRVGRHPDSDIFLDDITVSRRHAEIERSESGYVVRDVGSLNGTYLNRERVEESHLANGDEVQIGKFKLLFLAPEAS